MNSRRRGTIAGARRPRSPRIAVWLLAAGTLSALTLVPGDRTAHALPLLFDDGGSQDELLPAEGGDRDLLDLFGGNPLRWMILPSVANAFGDFLPFSEDGSDDFRFVAEGDTGFAGGGAAFGDARFFDLVPAEGGTRVIALDPSFALKGLALVATIPRLTEDGGSSGPVAVAPVPEPSSIAALGAGALIVAGSFLRRRRAKQS